MMLLVTELHNWDPWEPSTQVPNGANRSLNHTEVTITVPVSPESCHKYSQLTVHAYSDSFKTSMTFQVKARSTE